MVDCRMCYVVLLVYVFFEGALGSDGSSCGPGAFSCVE
jgi:hypothetical protein